MLFGAPLHGAPSSLLHVRSEPDDETRRCAECEREREAVPIVVRFVVDFLDHVWPDHGRCMVRQPEQAEELRLVVSSFVSPRKRGRTHHVVETRRGQLGHHRLH